MKRRSVKTILCVALLTLAMSATACGGSDSGSESAAPEATEEEAPAEEEEEPEEEAQPEEEASNDESGAKTLEEYLKEDPASEQQLKEQAEAQGNETLDMTFEVVGNDFICIGTFKDSVELPEDAAETLEAGMDELGTAFSALAGVLDEAIGAEKGTVSYGIRYCDSDGNVLAEKSFRAE